MKKNLFILILLVMLLAGFIVSAQDYFKKGGAFEQIVKYIVNVLFRVTKYLFGIFIIAAVIFFIIAGFQFVTAAGDPEKITKAKWSLFYGLIGVLVAFSAVGLVKLIKEIVGGGVSPPEPPPPSQAGRGPV